MKNIMVDLETLGNGSNAVIIAIGACQFDHTGTGQTFYTTVDPQSCIDRGMKIDASTVMWWMKQSDAARAAFDGRGLPILVALGNFSDYIKDSAGKGAEVWGNGATFDNVILDTAYKLTNTQKPWEFWADRCYRTLKNLYPQVVMDNFGTAHNALDDAIKQATHASAIMAYMRSKT